MCKREMSNPLRRHCGKRRTDCRTYTCHGRYRASAPSFLEVAVQSQQPSQEEGGSVDLPQGGLKILCHLTFSGPEESIDSLFDALAVYLLGDSAVRGSASSCAGI